MPLGERSLVERLYPHGHRKRRAQMTSDGIVVALVVLLAGLGWSLYAIVEQLTVLADGVQQAGTSVEGGFDRAADSVDGLPVLGDRLSDALADVGDTTGGRVVELGTEGRDRIRRTAILVGLLSFGVPTIGVLSIAVPRRISEARRLRAARALLVDATDPERRRLIALRAAVALPPEVLLRHTEDPIGDLYAGRLDALVAAVFDDLGLVPPDVAPHGDSP